MVFIDPAEREYKAEDLWLTGQNTDNQFRYQADGPMLELEVTRYSITINVIVDLTTSIVLMSRVIVSFKLSRVSDVIFTTMS